VTTTALDKVLLVLETLALGPATAPMIASSTGLNRTTVYRNLQALELNQYVIRDLIGRYVIGPALVNLIANDFRDPLQHKANEVLATMKRNTGADSVLYCAQGIDRVCIGASLPTPRGLAVGQRISPTDCASTVVLLAWSATRRMAARDIGVPHMQLALIRQQGWASSVGSNGVAEIAAPIRDETGEVIAALGIVGAPDLVKTRICAYLAPIVVAAAQQLTMAVIRTPR